MCVHDYYDSLSSNVLHNLRIVFLSSDRVCLIQHFKNIIKLSLPEVMCAYTCII